MCVSKLASREMAICTVTANVSHSYSLFFASETFGEKTHVAKNFLSSHARFQFAELVVFPRENTYVKRPRLADTDAHTQREIKR